MFPVFLSETFSVQVLSAPISVTSNLPGKVRLWWGIAEEDHSSPLEQQVL